MDAVAQRCGIAGERRSVALDRVARPAPRRCPIAVEIDGPGHGLADRCGIAADGTAMIGERPRSSAPGRGRARLRQPPVGVLRDGPQEVALTASPDHDRRTGPGAARSTRARAGTTRPRTSRAAGPERPDEPQTPRPSGRSAHGSAGTIAVRAVLLLEPAGAVAEDESPAAQRLDAGRHLGQECRMAIRVGEDAVPEHRTRGTRAASHVSWVHGSIR